MNREVSAAETEANKRGIKEPAVRSNIITSSANTIAAIGALNIPAIAPAAPQPNNKVVAL